MEYRFLAVALCIALTGCAMRHPMGLTTEQWNALSHEKQAELQAQQYAIDAAARRQRDAERMERERLAYEAAQAHAERMRQAYANAQYGDVVTVTIQGGTISWGGKPRAFEPISVDLIKGEAKAVEFHGRDIRASLGRRVIRLSEDGNTIYFDEDSSDRIVLVNRDWEHGESYSTVVGRNKDYGSPSQIGFHVKYKRLPGAPDRLIIETERRQSGSGQTRSHGYGR